MTFDPPPTMDPPRPVAAPAVPPVLDIDDLTVTYATRQGAIEAVSDLSLELGTGECLGLVGESGCGKSTVAWAVVSYLGANGAIEKGRIRFHGEDLVGKSEGELRRLRGDRIGMVYQNPMESLNPSMRVGAQLTEALTYHQNMNAIAARERCELILERVHLPNPSRLMKSYPHQLSGGQQQRIVIAMALLNEPSLLIMDEPTTALDVTVEAAVLDLVEELRSTFDTAILYISHNLGVVARICDRVAVMYSGELVEAAPTATLFHQPRHPYTQGLLACIPTLGTSRGEDALYSIPGQVPPPRQRVRGCRFSPRCAHAKDRCHSDRPSLRLLEDGPVRCHFAEEIESIKPSPAAAEGPVRSDEQSSQLQVDALKAHYPIESTSLRSLFGCGNSRFLRAVDGVSFSLPAGRTLGIVGESGCGKSTFVKTLIGLEESAGGSARFLGFDLTRPLQGRDRELIRTVQMVFQNPESTLNPSFRVGQQIGRSLRRVGSVPRGQVRARTLALLDAVKLDHSYFDRLPRQLSGGEKQRVGIARAFASRPDLVLCDEPVSALDVSVQSAILNLLQEIQRRHNTTMVLIAHDLAVVRYISDFVAVMYLGQLMESGPSEAVYAPPYHPYTEALLSAAPVADPSSQRRQVRLEGSLPSAEDPPSGCPFHTRCPRRHLLPEDGSICAREAPPRRESATGHRIYCHLPEEELAALDQTRTEQ